MGDSWKWGEGWGIRGNGVRVGEFVEVGRGLGNSWKWGGGWGIRGSGVGVGVDGRIFVV